MAATLTEALSNVRSLIDEPVAQFWSDAELTEWINQGCAEIQREVEWAGRAHGHRHHGGHPDLLRAAGLPPDLPARVRAQQQHELHYWLEFRGYNEMDAAWGNLKTLPSAYPEQFTLWNNPNDSGPQASGLTILLYPVPAVDGYLEPLLLPDHRPGGVGRGLHRRAARMGGHRLLLRRLSGPAQGCRPPLERLQAEFSMQIEQMKSVSRTYTDQPNWFSTGHRTTTPSSWIWTNELGPGHRPIRPAGLLHHDPRRPGLLQPRRPPCSRRTSRCSPQVAGAGLQAAGYQAQIGPHWARDASSRTPTSPRWPASNWDNSASRISRPVCGQQGTTQSYQTTQQQNAITQQQEALGFHNSQENLQGIPRREWGPQHPRLDPAAGHPCRAVQVAAAGAPRPRGARGRQLRPRQQNYSLIGKANGLSQQEVYSRLQNAYAQNADTGAQSMDSLVAQAGGALSNATQDVGGALANYGIYAGLNTTGVLQNG